MSVKVAVDISNYGGELTAEVVRCWKRNGVSKVIVGVSHKVELARRQMQAVVAEGLTLDAYCYIYWGNDPALYLERVVTAGTGLPLGRIWIDCEDVNAPKNNPEAVCGWIRACLAAAELRWPGRVGIYTARWWWVPWAGDYQGFSDYPLWVAQYDGNADTAFAPFGGWQRAMKQYTNTVDLCGYSVCRDAYEEDDMPDEVEDAIIETRNRARVADVRDAIAGRAQANDMNGIVAILVYCGVLPPGTVALKAAIEAA